MHESVERQVRWSQSEVVLYKHINGLRSVIWLACGAFWSDYILRTYAWRSFTNLIAWRVRKCHECFLFDSNLNWVIRMTLLSVFSVGGHILFYSGLFKILIYLKGFLLWLMVGTEKVGSSPLTPGWYKESLICYYFYFFIHR
jgi:hypothetical protein